MRVIFVRHGESTQNVVMAGIADRIARGELASEEFNATLRRDGVAGADAPLSSLGETPSPPPNPLTVRLPT